MTLILARCGKHLQNIWPMCHFFHKRWFKEISKNICEECKIFFCNWLPGPGQPQRNRPQSIFSRRGSAESIFRFYISTSCSLQLCACNCVQLATVCAQFSLNCRALCCTFYVPPQTLCFAN